MTTKEIILAHHRGFCAGVDRAVKMTENAIEKLGVPLYVKHEIVHNKYVIEQLQAKGVKFIEDLETVPIGKPVIFSAHGVSKQVRKVALDRKLQQFDATCPLVTKVHVEVQKYLNDGCQIVLIGHENHPETEGTLGQVPAELKHKVHLICTLEEVDRLAIDKSEKIAYATQTTLSVDDTSQIIERLKAKYPNIQMPKKSDICYATQNRQDAVKQLTLETEFIVIIGSKNSSNSNRLLEIAKRCGVQGVLIDYASELDMTLLENITKVGITAGASAPEHLVQELVDYLLVKDFKSVRVLAGETEKVNFPIPKQLRL